MSEAIMKAKEIAKAAGVKGFRKLRLKAVKHIIGRQGSWLSPEVAHKLLDEMLALGFHISMLTTLRALADKSNLDMITICGLGSLPVEEESPAAPATVQNITTNTVGGYISVCNKAGQEIGGIYPASINLVMFKQCRGTFETMEAALLEADRLAGMEIPGSLDALAMNAAPEMRALESFGLNPTTITETLQRVTNAMRADGLKASQITREVLVAYMEADRKKQERMFMDYMTNQDTRKRVQGVILDMLEVKA